MNPSLKPEYKPELKLEKGLAYEKSKQLLMLYRLLGHIPQDLMSLDPEKIRKFLDKRHPDLEPQQKENAVNRMLGFVADFVMDLFLAIASDTPTFEPQPAHSAAPAPQFRRFPTPKQQPMPQPGKAPSLAFNSASFFNKPPAPMPQAKKRPDLEPENQLDKKRRR
ncbi:MAG TPA: hypothetical protein VHA13_05705, partial [Gammaproteobacteria bacterium]|nr:hypothetical protein [Gammaproteobacteria bacterium]